MNDLRRSNSAPPKLKPRLNGTRVEELKQVETITVAQRPGRGSGFRKHSGAREFYKYLFMSTFDDALDAVDGFGRYQKFFCVVALYSTLLWAGDFSVDAFASKKSVWSCADEQFSNQSWAYDDTISGNASLCNMIEQCSPNNLSASNDFHSITEEFRLICDRKHVTELIFILQLFAQFLGSLIGGHIGDIWGRKKCLYIAMYGLCLSSVYSVAARSWEVFAGLQAVNSFIYGIVEVTVITLSFEIISRKYRFVAIACFQWSAAYPILATIAFFTKHWRLYLIMVNCISAPILLAYVIVGESPRWLLLRIGADKAAMKLNELGSSIWNCTRVHIDPADLGQIRRLDPVRTAWALFTHVDLRLESMMQCLAMSAYGLTRTVFMRNAAFNVADNPYVNVGLNGLVCIWIPPVLVFFDTHCLWFSRKLLWWSSLLATVLAYGVWTFLSFTTYDGHGQFFSKLCTLFGSSVNTTAFYMVTVTITAEFYPTSLRSIAIGTFAAVEHLSSIGAVLLLHLGHYWPPLPFVLVTLYAAIVFCVGIRFQAETKDHSMKDCLNTRIGQLMKRHEYLHFSQPRD